MIAVSQMKRRHVKDVMRIENVSYPQPWSAQLFSSELALSDSRAYCVAHDGDDLVGYGGLMMVVEDAHITNIAVAPDRRRTGVAKVLMCELWRKACQRGARNMTLEVRVSNTAAQHLYFQFGFAPAGIRKNYYESREDALIMWAYDIDSDDYARRIIAIEKQIDPTNRELAKA